MQADRFMFRSVSDRNRLNIHALKINHVKTVPVPSSLVIESRDTRSRSRTQRREALHRADDSFMKLVQPKWRHS